jgi:hypothetical protein
MGIEKHERAMASLDMPQQDDGADSAASTRETSQGLLSALLESKRRK